MSNKPKLCLNMIVKDEGHVIEQTLECVSKFIDYYVINDTGSTDNTIQIIKDFFDKKGIPGEIYEHEFRSCKCHNEKYKKYSFFHFGWNRSYALEKCMGKSEYIWIIDADDIIVGDFVLPELKSDSYMLQYGTGFTYGRQQIFKNDLKFDWYYEGALHEYMKCNKPDITRETIKGNYYIDSRRLGARSADPQKYLKDALVFEELLRDDPNNERSMFYCGQSYFDYKDFQNSMKWYKKRIEVGGWFEEVFYSYYRIAECLSLLNNPWQDVEKAYLETHTYSKNRAEPLYKIANHYRMTNEYAKGYKFAKMGIKIPFPQQCVLFVFKDVYDYKLLDELAICAFHLGRYHECQSIHKKLLEQSIIPLNERKIIETNLELAEVKINELNKTLCCFYLGNEYFNYKEKDTLLTKLLEFLDKNFKLIVVGNKIEFSQESKIVCLTTSSFREINKINKMNIDHLILYNNLNFFYDDIQINPKFTILFQTDNFLKVIVPNGMNIHLYQNDILNKHLNKINKIICSDVKTKNKLANDYGILNENIDYMENESEYYKIGESELKISYKCRSNIVAENNGYIFIEPVYIKTLIENKLIYDFSNKMLVNFYQEVKQYLKNSLETNVQLAHAYFNLNEYTSALTSIEETIKLSKNEKSSFKDYQLMIKSKILNKQEKYQESFNLADEVLKRNQLPEILRMQAENIRDINIDFIKDYSLTYPQNKISKIKKDTVQNPNIMFSITCCKRFDLFEKTINSFINCCNDYHMIDYWYCVDDNSSEEDRIKMNKKYPFFHYQFKNEQQKGHSISMNMIHQKALELGVEYIVHIEDDWHFIEKRDYLNQGIKIHNEDKKYGQVLFNKNYAEIEPVKRRIMGGSLKKTKDGTRYVVHEHFTPNTAEYLHYLAKYPNCLSVTYWPHFSFRPSILKTAMLKEVGIFVSTAHFELAYAKEYINAGYKSVFLDTFSSIHIGKKTWETDSKNSYSLNQTPQFGFTDSILNIQIVSEDTSNVEKWKKFKEVTQDLLPHFKRHIPRSITNLNEFEKKIFVGNNFNYLRSQINKIMVHIDILKENQSSYLLVLFDDIMTNENTSEGMKFVFNNFKDSKYEMIVFEDTVTEAEHQDLAMESESESTSSESDSDNSEELEQDHNSFNFIKYNKKVKLDNLKRYIINTVGIKKLLCGLELVSIKNLDDVFNTSELEIGTLNKSIFNYKINKVHNEELNNMEDFNFYSQMDSFGNDIKYVGVKTLEELKESCKNDDNCLGFNTLGYLKSKINEEKDFIFLPTSKTSKEGLYCKK